jgi:hypothetical protein
MRKLVFPALAGLAALSAVAFAPSKADAQVSIGIGVDVPGGYHQPVQWGPGPDWDAPPRRHYRPAPPEHYGVYRPDRHHHEYRPYRHHREPTCWVERRWVETPWGPRPRPVRICR